ncbi:MAG TPA: twin-arginine translocation signal domain-containing protein, partial [Chryseosolibacter sp.]
MATLTKTSRRNFMKLAAAAGGGLMLGFHWSDAEASAMEVLSVEALGSANI